MSFRIIHLFLIFLLLFSTSPLQSSPLSNDSPSTFFKSTGYVSNIYSLPTSMRISQPWSGSYWPLTYGGIGWRYNAQYQIYSQPSDHNSRYGTSSFSIYIRDNYSPAEKYDFLVGDYSYTLTRYTRTRRGRAALWEGICHGWAPAAVKEPTPKRSVTLYASDGRTKVTFYADDIKALASQYYASAMKNYKTDIMGDNGTYNNNNPASFYIAITNLIGLRKTAMIYDAAVGGTIWNYPAYSYSTSFYNPSTNLSSNINGSMVSIYYAALSNSYNARVAASNAAYGTAYLIGVVMTVHYTNETQPRRGTPFGNATAGRTYNFILELSSTYNIIGGTWVSADRPDFIWKINEAYGIRKDALDNVSGFNGSAVALRKMTATAKRLSMKSMPIYAIMRYLVLNSS